MAESDPIYINIRNYKLNFDEIGRGAFGNVYHGINTDTNEVVAAKKVKYKDGGQSINEVLSEMGQREGEILSRLNGHRNIVKLLDYFDDKSSYWFIMEFCSLNDLPKYMKNQAIDIDVNAKVRIMVDVASGLAFMHGMTPPVIHRDVKAENILMKQEGKRHIAKISDFGMGKLFEADTNHFTMTSGVGTMGYMAPEFFVDGEYLRYQPGVDTFALGLLFSVVLLYDKKCTEMKPMSVQSRTFGKYMHYGFEMKNAYNSKTPMPHLFEQGAERNPCVAQIREIISAMTQFHDRDRPSLQQVKTQILESYYELIQFENISAEFSKLKTENFNLKIDHESLKQERNVFKEEHDKLQRYTDTLQQDHDALYRDHNDVQQEKVNLQRNLGNLQTDHGKLVMQHSKLKTDNGTLQTSLGSLRIEIGTGEEKHGKLQLDYGNLQVESGKLEMDHGQLKTEHGTLTREYGQLKSEYGALQREYGQIENKIGNTQIENGKLLQQNGQLLSEIGEIQSRLATEMSEKMSNNESSIENVSIKHCPVKVVDEYQAFCTNEWLDLKQFLDGSFPQEPEKKKMNLLTNMLMHSYATTVTKHQQIAADLNVRLIHPMASADSEIFSTLKLHEHIRSSQQLKQYIISCARLCWKMVLQRPPMTFDVAGIKEPLKPDLQEPVWGSADPNDPRSVVAAYTHPALYHNQKLMVKGKVLLGLKK